MFTPSTHIMFRQILCLIDNHHTIHVMIHSKFDIRDICAFVIYTVRVTCISYVALSCLVSYHILSFVLVVDIHTLLILAMIHVRIHMHSHIPSHKHHYLHNHMRNHSHNLSPSPTHNHMHPLLVLMIDIPIPPLRNFHTMIALMIVIEIVIMTEQSEWMT